LAYCFERHESVAVGVGRIIGELTWTTTNELHPGHPEHQDWVHNTRTRCKRIRSLLRLVRTSLGEETYRAELARAREVAERLSRLRDAEVLVLTGDAIDEQATGPDESLIELRRWLRERYARIAQIETNLQQLLLATAKEMDDLTLRSANWSLPEDFHQPVAQFVRGYRRGRRKFAEAYEQPHDEAFHEWRKRVKDHWYHCCLFDTVWPPPMIGRQQELKTLSDYLGEDHDLSVLREVLSEETGAPAVSDRLDAHMNSLQQQLRERGRELAQRIYDPEPEWLGGELQRNLERWR
jgi:CHAD domain-containing protein